MSCLYLLCIESLSFTELCSTGPLFPTSPLTACRMRSCSLRRTRLIWPWNFNEQTKPRSRQKLQQGQLRRTQSSGWRICFISWMMQNTALRQPAPHQSLCGRCGSDTMYTGQAVDTHTILCPKLLHYLWSGSRSLLFIRVLQLVYNQNHLL